MKLTYLKNIPFVYWAGLAIGIVAIVFAALLLASPGEPRDRPTMTAAKVTEEVGSYLVKTELVSEKPAAETFSAVEYVNKGKWSGKYTGPSAWGSDSTIVWEFWEQATATQVILGYENQ